MNEESIKQLLRAFLNGANPNSDHSGLGRYGTARDLMNRDVFEPLSYEQEDVEIEDFVQWYMGTVYVVYKENQRRLEALKVVE